MMARRKIRVGMINCDLHAFYYAPLMQDYDLDALLRYWRVVNFYFGDMFDAAKFRIPRVRQFDIVKVYDPRASDIGRIGDGRDAEHLAEMLYGRPKVCDRLEDVSDDVDMVFVANCSDNGSLHRRLATPGLRKGVPTFVDKPFAYDLADARAMIKLAQKHKAPLFSMSMLRISPHADRFRRRFDEIAPVEFGTVRGGWVHAINLALNLFGDGVKSVNCMAEPGYDAPERGMPACIRLDYSGRRDRPAAGVVLHCGSGGLHHCAYHASAYSSRGAIHSPPIGDFEFPDAAVIVLRMIVKMVREGCWPVPPEHLIEPIAVAAAARESCRLKRPVALTGR